ncbi:Hypothetical protein MALK_0930 [Metamycoplasma alkalescens 14918]|uniref:Uncharacterized protein n=1 Tax=Metamycoplasma alkalescens 14918 TaxID=1188234 RepID=N9SRE9_9BACT|nr:hypothetical protein [Metamycoplasma alkalescens]ENY54040.1 Hypothetical protein MALK_0930 [Metamycoplasma alkalescens 14918]
MNNEMMIGIVYKQRNKGNKLPIAKDKYGNLIEGHGTNRPYVIFYSDKKVYYLSLKSVTNQNRIQTSNDKSNFVSKIDTYDQEKEIAINCSVINVMDRDLFESLYVEDKKNNFQTSPQIYDEVMNILYKNINYIKYFEVDHFDFKNNNTIWKTDEQAIKNQKICVPIIKAYANIDRKIIDKLKQDPKKFYQYVEDVYKKVVDNDKKINDNDEEVNDNYKKANDNDKEELDNKRPLRL